MTCFFQMYELMNQLPKRVSSMKGRSGAFI
ncbi:MAG: hypothetical protein JWL63_2108 [Rhodocyclales bacterium]|nr:hypothetical protein [Rhodocyclales bacterium]